MGWNEVENLLAQRLGFDVHTVGPQAVEGVVRKCMREAGLSDPDAYARTLATDPEAWKDLVESVVIPETWFFRDVAPFELAGDVARKLLRNASNKFLRILSCPCSTGEEPYSLAIAMLHAGAPAESFCVEAIDVSVRALESAQAAKFRARSFRDDAPWYRAPYFDYSETDASWHLKDVVASRVRFRQGNLVAPDFLTDDSPYDIVFCRNLLIYLHAEARLSAITALHRLVADDGVLVLGHAEATFARDHGFTPTGPPAAFAMVKSHHAVPARHAKKNDRNIPANITSRFTSNTPVPAAAPAPAVPVAVVVRSAEPSPSPNLLTSARQLGDAGKLQDALQACTEYLKRVPDSAEGHFLFAVLHDAIGHTELAVRSFRKVLYLDPTHREALLHLALKREALGDLSGAALLRARARRAPDALTTD